MRLTSGQLRGIVRSEVGRVLSESHVAGLSHKSSLRGLVTEDHQDASVDPGLRRAAKEILSAERSSWEDAVVDAVSSAIEAMLPSASMGGTQQQDSSEYEVVQAVLAALEDEIDEVLDQNFRGAGMEAHFPGLG